MVHNLRSRNICGTTGDRPRNAVVVRLDNETPRNALTDGDRNNEINENVFNMPDLEPELENVSAVPHHIFTSTRIETALPDRHTDVRNISPIKEFASFNSFQLNLQTVIDETVFKGTYNNHKSISLHGIRKGIQEFGYNAKRTQKQSLVYVRECLDSGKLLQKSGRGANGSFRLEPKIHNNFIKAHKENRIHKIRNVSATALCLKRLKRHDIDINAAIQSNILSLAASRTHSQYEDKKLSKASAGRKAILF